MNFLELAKERFSVRKFSDTLIEKEKLDLILEAGKVAPTAANFQPQKIYVIQSDEALEKINSVCKCIYGAKTVLLIAFDKNLDWKNPNQEGIHAGQQDVSIVATHMMLEAWELGIGSCWVNAFSNEMVREAMGLPENEEVVLLLPLGYADTEAKPMEKWHTSYRPDEEVITYL